MLTAQSHSLKNNHTLVIREAAAQDAQAVLDYVHAISGETDFLSFGPGEFEVPLDREREILQRYHKADNQLYLIGLLDSQIVSTLSFSGGHRPRIRHTGETDNQRAITLYERKGFVLEGTIRRAICIDGTYYDHHWMGIEL
jgi:RimJ/RimL family protein N-acetyltransferase